MGWFHKDLELELDEIVRFMAKKLPPVPQNWEWFKNKRSELHELDQRDVQLMRKLRELHGRHLDNPQLASTIFEKARRLHRYLSILLSQQLPNIQTLKLVTSLTEEIVRLYEQEASYTNAYERFIVSTPYAYRFLHRTNRAIVGKIMEEGLGQFPGGIQQSLHVLESTTTYAPENLEKAREQFQKRHRDDNVVVIIEVPRSIADDAKKRVTQKLIAEAKGGIMGIAVSERWNFVQDPIISYRPYGPGSLMLKPEYVLGYIDREDNSVHLNPKYKLAHSW